MRHRLPRGARPRDRAFPSGKTGVTLESSRPCRCRAHAGVTLGVDLVSGLRLCARRSRAPVCEQLRGLECGPGDFRGPPHKHGRIARSSRVVSAGLDDRVHVRWTRANR
jgi:hypothetical protein